MTRRLMPFWAAASIALAAGAHAQHILISYDVSGSMKERWVGPEMHGLIRELLPQMLFGDGPAPGALPEAGPDRVRAESSERPGFKGFPLAGPGATMSVFAFAESATTLASRVPAEPGRLPPYPIDMIGAGSTNITNATRAAVFEGVDPRRDGAVYWVLVSDDLDDPLNPAVQGDLKFTERELAQLYTHTLHVPAALHAAHRARWERGDAELVRAFGEKGPPQFVRVKIYGVKDTAWAEPPRELRYALRERTPEGTPVELSFYPGEWQPQQPQRAARAAAERAERYRVQRRGAAGEWTDLGEPIPASGSEPYTVDLGPQPDGDLELRVVALQFERPPLVSQPLGVHVFRIEMPQLPPIEAGKTTRIAWTSPRSDEVTMHIDRSGDRGATWPTLGAVPSSMGYFETDQLQPGDWVRFRALCPTGECGVEIATSGEPAPEPAAEPVPAPEPPPAPEAPEGEAKGEGPAVDPPAPGGGGAFLLLVLLIALAAAGALAWQMRPRPADIVIEWSDRIGQDGAPLSKSARLERNERFLFAAGGDDDPLVIDKWPEIDAPADYLQKTWRGVHHRRAAAEDRAGGPYDVDEPLLSGDPFTVIAANGDEVQLRYVEREASQPDAQQNSEGGSME